MAIKIQQSQSPENSEISLKELILRTKGWSRYLLSKWIVISLFVIMGGVIGFFYARSKKAVYTATTTFVLEEGEKGGLGGLGGLASIAGINLGEGGGLFQGDNILQLYKSRTMIEKTLLDTIDESKELLVDRFIAFNELKKQWKNNPKLSNIKFGVNTKNYSEPDRRLRDSIMGSIVSVINKNYLTVSKPDKKLSTIQVNVNATDEIFAKVFNNHIVQKVNDFYKQTKTKKTIDNINILQHKTDSVRRVMNGAIYDAASVADATPNLNPTRQVQRMAPIQRSQFSAETNKGMLGLLVQNLEMTKTSLLKETPLIQVIDEPIYPLRVEKLGVAKGSVFGAFLAGFLAVIGLVLSKIYKEIISDE
ncbi:lipopolysaccharide biosynthesis protein [Pedobacter yonginense]|uniref:Lipopolysaccharide biosynthesis protein n=1 Tax=Pedobacter yonginense TaxID=651869 RepID=A0A317ENH0_9SPHI|nr:lipopolysaccharide biosynthesis protein [Pedobacter yonginense]PWS28164.1 lipopolysaccharide biosynthesis protein [Pedobacter yonginense]